MSILLAALLLSTSPSFAESYSTCPDFLIRENVCQTGRGHCLDEVDYDCEKAPENVRLLGRGVVNAEHPASIALACADNACFQLRYLYSSMGKAYFFGPTYQVPHGPRSSGADLELTRDLMAKILKSLRINEAGTLGMGAKLTGIFSDREGWNWSDQPAKRTHSEFQTVLQTVDGYHDVSLVDSVAQSAVNKICGLKQASGGFVFESATWINFVLQNRGNAQMYFSSLILDPENFLNSLKRSPYRSFFTQPHGEACTPLAL